ncbi:MAG TPA: mechanosensitive ion channel domain-containing protein [Candidatus Sulfotelmatobacter sp.]|jgi:small conductance mechanosensitive channel|nr:mechanosensitive ion channel domain-containing protein [Candidatus Sulfotelmatobacter sp.]
MVDIIIIQIAEAVATVAIAWLIAETLIRVISRAAKKAGASADLIRTVREAISILWIVLAAVGIIVVTGLTSLFSFLTLSGIVGLAISLALQNTLSNVISGVLLLSDGALRLHDSVAYSGLKGEVVKLGLRSTWVRTESGDIAIISNTYLQAGPLINHSALSRLEKKLRV